jgi:hypothetical protein
MPYETIFFWGWGIVIALFTFMAFVLTDTKDDPMSTGIGVFFGTVFLGWLWPIAVALILLCLIVWLIRIPVLGRDKAALM